MEQTPITPDVATDAAKPKNPPPTTTKPPIEKEPPTDVYPPGHKIC